MSSTTSATSNPVTIASSTSAGAAGGSVINVSQLVSQLVQATQGPQQALITNKTQTVTTQISALGTLKSALSTFQSSLSSLDTPNSFNAQTATSSDRTAFTASVSSGAPVGTYSVAITALAKAQQLLSSPFVGTGTTSVGTGTLQLSLGSSSFNVDITSSNDTLNGIAAQINTAAGNPGITATVLQGSDGAHLVLTSTLTGSANTIAVSETDSGNALSALNTGDPNNYKEQSPAQDAAFTIAGVSGTSPSNTVTNALTGVTLNLLATNTTDTTSGTASGNTSGNATVTTDTLTVSTDTSSVSSNIQSFVSAYNTLAGAFSSLGSYDASTNTAGPMLGDALLSSVKNQIHKALYSVVDTGSRTYNSLASIGITTNSDGTLKVNTGTLSTALSTNFSAVSQLFSGASGVATALNTQIAANLGTSGAVTSRSQTLIKQENDLSKQTTDLNSQMTALSASLTQQYSSLNTLLSSLQTTSAYLTQAFATLPSVQSKSG